MSNHTDSFEDESFLPKKRRSDDDSSNTSSIFAATPINYKEQGVQGTVMKCLWKDEPAVMKMSNHIDFVLELEEEAWTLLKKLNCLHFCEVFEKLPIKPGERRYCLFYKEITNNSRNDSVGNLIFEQAHHPNAILNCVRQTLAAMVMFEELGITHYDLHSDNAMVTDTPYDVHVYKFGDKIVPIRTYGLAPVIIDFGLAYIPNTRYNASCVFAKDGFTTYMPDPIVDSRLLLMTTVRDLKESVKTLRSRTRRVFNSQYKDTCIVIEQFIKKVELIFSPLKLNRETGWFKNEDLFPNVLDGLKEQLPQEFQKTKKGVFKPDNFSWIIELLQHELTIPVTQYKPDAPSFAKSTCMLAIEWKQFVEPVIRNTHEEQLFFKDLVSIPHDAEVNAFTRLRSRYPKIKNIKRLRGHVKAMGDAFNNFLYDKTIEAQRIKDTMYAKLPFRTTKDILCALPSMPNVYSEGMTLLVMDPSARSHKQVVLDEGLASMLNENEQDAVKYIV